MLAFAFRPRLRIATLSAVIVATVLASACVPQAVEQPERDAAKSANAPATQSRPDGFPDAFYQRAIVRGERVYRVDARSSIVTVEVRRAGSLSRLGHDHVVAAHDLQGYIVPASNRADLLVRLDALVVDEPELRKAAGFETVPSPEAVAGTRTNMLERTLNAEHYPWATVRVRSIAPIGTISASADVDVSITLHGHDKTFRVPVRIEFADDSVRVTGDLAFNQTDFGITPLSILGGAIAVQDGLTLHYRVRAVRVRDISEM
jgi:hypothetical protein